MNIHSQSFPNRSTLLLLSGIRVSREIFLLFLNSVGCYGDEQYVLKTGNSSFAELSLTSRGWTTLMIGREDTSSWQHATQP